MECDAISQCESISLCIIGNGVIAGNSRNKSAIGSRLYKPFVQIENHVSSSCVRIYMGVKTSQVLRHAIHNAAAWYWCSF